jgi:hypothetical protein
MRLPALALLSAAALSLAACTTAKDSYLENGYRLLPGDEVRALHRDMTYDLKLASGRTAVAFYAANGRSSFRRSDGVSDLGVWEIRGNQVCYVYQQVPGTEHNCYSLAEKNGQYLFFKEFESRQSRKGDVGAEVVSVTPGNVKDLPLE